MVEGEIVHWKGVNRIEQGVIREIDGEMLLIDLPNGKQMTINTYNLIRQDND